MKHTLLFPALCLLLALCPVAQSQTLGRYPLVPWPQHLESRAGDFALDSLTQVTVAGPGGTDIRPVATFWAEQVRLGSGLPLPVVPASGAAPGAVAFVLDASAPTGEEGYTLDVTAERVTLTAATPAGLFYGAQTLTQLLPPGVARGGVVRGGDGTRWTLPAVFIRDAPRFSYRGMHLDVVRHFFPVSFVKRYIDLMARYKMNRFHWHLTDDQGWRIEIKKYPRLTEIGAWRDGTLIGHYDNVPQRFDSVRYGGFYTQDEIREVVAYAAARHVTIVPEIEMPGHASAAIAAYPTLGCRPGPVQVVQTWGVFEDIFCPKEETFAFLEDVLTEVMALFPGEFIHIGGDEAPKKAWEESDVAQQVIRREGLKADGIYSAEHALQSYFVGRIERFLNANGRKLIGWDEIIEGGLSPTATIMYWRSWDPSGLREAARQGNGIVMTPGSPLYFDHYQADPATEPVAIGGLETLEMVYAYEPVPAFFTDAQARHVLGAQANLWTEYIETPQKVEYMVFPRLLALAEVVWSPREARNWFSFRGRLPDQLERLRILTVNYRPFEF